MKLKRLVHRWPGPSPCTLRASTNHCGGIAHQRSTSLYRRTYRIETWSTSCRVRYVAQCLHKDLPTPIYGKRGVPITCVATFFSRSFCPPPCHPVGVALHFYTVQGKYEGKYLNHDIVAIAADENPSSGNPEGFLDCPAALVGGGKRVTDNLRSRIRIKKTKSELAVCSCTCQVRIGRLSSHRAICVLPRARARVTLDVCECWTRGVHKPPSRVTSYAPAAHLVALGGSE